MLGDLLHLRNADVIVDPSTDFQFAGVYSFGRGVFRSKLRRGSEFSCKRLTRLERDDFVYPKLMAWEGAFGVVPADCDGFFVSPEFPVFSVDKTKLFPGYLGYYFRKSEVWKTVSGGSTGTNVRRRRLHPSQLLKVRIPLPSLAIQRRLVQQLDAANARIARSRDLLNKIADDLGDFIVAAHFQASDRHTMQLGEGLELQEERVLVEPGSEFPQVGLKGFGGGLFAKPAISVDQQVKLENAFERIDKLRHTTTQQELDRLMPAMLDRVFSK
jgi:hypothetical protein